MRLNKVIASALSLVLVGGAVNTTMDTENIFQTAALTDIDYAVHWDTNGVVYRIYSDYVVCGGCNNSVTDIVIASEIQGLPVTTITASAFSLDEITSVVIPDSVTTIGGRAFKNCENLTDVTIPDSVTTIGNNAFGYCSSLEEIVIPDSVTSFGTMMFSSCTNLKKVILPEGITEVSPSTFTGCLRLESVNISESVVTIGGYAFQSCIKLSTITIPNSVKTIGNGAFAGCDYLNTVTIPESVTSIGEDAFQACEYMQAFMIKNPDCEIFDDKTTISNYGESGYDGTIYGEVGSTAQAYAEKYGYKFSTISLGDMTGDGAINALDASDILRDYSVQATYGGNHILDGIQCIYADVNGNGSINAIDASLILGYYAYTATGGSGTLEDYLK